MNLIERLDEAGKRWNVLEHPFYRRWERGQLTREELAFYAGEYRHAVVALADSAAAAGDPEHAAEESAHVDLWDDFAAALGAAIDRDPTDETRACTAAWRRDDPLEARAVLYAVESRQPDVSRTKLAGLVEHYGFAEHAPETAYFAVHVERDEVHAASARRSLVDVAESEDDRLVAAATDALEGNWRLLDAVTAA